MDLIKATHIPANPDNILILEDIFPEWFQHAILKACETMPWGHLHTGSYLDEDTKEDSFTKILYWSEGNIYDDHQNLIKYVNDALTLDVIPKAISDASILNFIRARANATLAGYELNPHIDNYPNQQMWTLVYYVNDSSGDTVFYDDQKNEIKRSVFKKGNAVLFPAHYWHKADMPDRGIRISLGYVYKIDTRLNKE